MYSADIHVLLLILTMSASQRLIARLPLEIFVGLRHDQQNSDNNHVIAGKETVDADLNADVQQLASSLRHEICTKLQSFSRSTPKGITHGDCVTTVGGLLNMSTVSLLMALDPLLTYCKSKESDSTSLLDGK